MLSNITKRLVIVWFLILSFTAGFNLWHNLVDSNKQSTLEATYEENKDRYESSIAEHQIFKDNINYLSGRVDALSNKGCGK